MEFIKLFYLVLCYNFVLCQFEKTCQTLDGVNRSCILSTNSDISFAPPTPEPAIPIVIEEKFATESRNEFARNIFDKNYATTLPQPPVCGISHGSLGRITKGVDANLGDYPWMALMGFKESTQYRWECGGTLITSRHVLTAGHLKNVTQNLQLVRLGELDLSRDDDGACPIDVPIKTIILHQEYNEASWENDIGIIVLQEIVQFTDFISPICLPTWNMRSESFENHKAIIAGWGKFAYTQMPATRLQMAYAPVINNDECVKAYQIYPQRVIDERVICTKRGGMNACGRDSGGPLMMPLMNDAIRKPVFYQIGIISYGLLNCDLDHSAVFTRTTHFLPWIEYIVRGS